MGQLGQVRYSFYCLFHCLLKLVTIIYYLRLNYLIRLSSIFRMAIKKRQQTSRIWRCLNSSKEQTYFKYSHFRDWHTYFCEICWPKKYPAFLFSCVSKILLAGRFFITSKINSPLEGECVAYLQKGTFPDVYVFNRVLF